MKKTIIFAVLMVLSATAMVSSQQFDNNAPTLNTTLILVRHAEKMSDSDDPGLTQQGELRAKKLYEMVLMADISAIYSTDYTRTKETVKKVSEGVNVPVGIYTPAPDREETERWIEKHSGETVLVSGHSNTIPTIANNLLGYTHFEDVFDESDYENLLIITVNGNNRTILHLRY